MKKLRSTTMAEVKVHGAWFSPFVKRVEMALQIKGVEYEYIEQNLTNKSPLLLELNPVEKKVPVLVHNGNAIVESLVILEYIDEAWEGPSILPKDPYEKAQARFWAHFIDVKCRGAIWKACWSKGEEREKAKEEAMEALKYVEEELNGKKFFGGDKIGLVDIVANFMPHWTETLGELVGLQFFTQDNFPNLCRWADDYCNDSLVKKNLADKGRLVTFFKTALETGRLYN